MILSRKLKRKPKVGEEDVENSSTTLTLETKQTTARETTTIITDGVTITIITTITTDGETTITMVGETTITIVGETTITMVGEIKEEIKVETKADPSGGTSMEWSGSTKCKNIKEMSLLSKSTTLKSSSKTKSSLLNRLHTNKNLKSSRKMVKNLRTIDSLLINSL